MTWAVSAISGTKYSTGRPCRRDSAAACKYTSVLPDPVTP